MHGHMNVKNDIYFITMFPSKQLARCMSLTEWMKKKNKMMIITITIIIIIIVIL